MKGKIFSLWAYFSQYEGKNGTFSCGAVICCGKGDRHQMMNYQIFIHFTLGKDNIGGHQGFDGGVVSVTMTVLFTHSGQFWAGHDMIKLFETLAVQFNLSSHDKFKIILLFCCEMPELINKVPLDVKKDTIK